MKYRIGVICSVVALASITSGCTSVTEKLNELDSREQTVTNVMGDIWEMTAVWPHEPRALQVRNHVNLEANKFCYRKKRGTQLLEQSSSVLPDGKGSKATVVFRCVHTMAPPPGAGLFSDDDSK